ncbi:MAG: FMN-binding protein [Pseudohongiellaceae bacterium]|nr:FMN-binding protein [Pseudohongiellaceae bacterium]
MKYIGTNTIFRSGLVLALCLLCTALLYSYSDDKISTSQREFDRRNLFKILTPDLFNNDLLLDTYLLRAAEEQEGLIGVSALGLRRDRLAYIARQDEEVVAVLVPATVADGFNGFVDLLIAVNMQGRILNASVIEDIETDALYGVVKVIDSHWMKNFTGNTMRDMRRLSWSTIEPVPGEYDQFVGASLTPKAVANRIYDALVFFQSNRIVLMQGDQS